MKKIEIQGLSFKYKVYGEGPVIFMLHGFGGGPADWAEIARFLEDGYKIRIYDP